MIKRRFSWKNFFVVLIILVLVCGVIIIQKVGSVKATTSFLKHWVDSDFYVTHCYPADVDGDDDIDVIATGSDYYSGPRKVVWYENNGSQSFSQHTLINSNGGDLVFPVDFDDDKHLDILNPSSLIVLGFTWFENDGNESFVREVVSYTYASNWVATSDLDKDNDIEIISAGKSDLSWWEQWNDNGTITFTHRILDNQEADHVIVIDVDSDTDTDIIAAGSGQVAWWENNGMHPPGFSEHLIDSSFQSGLSIFAVDLDHDGDIDVLGSYGYNPSHLVWWENDGSENFNKQEISHPNIWVITSVRAADLNGDGEIDIAAASDDDGLGWWENDGNENFTYHNIVGFAYEGVRVLEIADINKDSKLDLVTCRQGDVSGKDINWWENGMTAPGNVKQAHFRIGYDKPLDALTWYDVTDTAAANLSRETNFRVRFQVYNDGGVNSDWSPQLEWSTAASSGFAKVPLTSGSAPFYMSDTSQFSDGAAISSGDFALGLGMGTAQSGVAYDTSNPPNSVQSLTNGDYTEIEFNIRANENAAYDTMYYFRLTDAGTSLNAYDIASAAVEMASVQGTVSGTVKDTDNNDLANVNVGLGGAVDDTTDSSGEYSISTDPGTYEIEFDLQGYWVMTETVTIVGEEQIEKNAVMVAESGCLTSDTSCALSLIKLIPVVGTVAQLADVARVANDLCQVGELYEAGEYDQCAAKIALWLAQAVKVPVISQLLDLAEGVNTVKCVVDRLDAVGQQLGKVAIAFWDYIMDESGEETVIVFQLRDSSQVSALGEDASGGIDFVLTDSQGNALDYKDGQIKQRSIGGSIALSSDNQGYTIGIISQPSADFNLAFTGSVAGDFDLDVILPQGDGTSIKLTYEGLPITPQTIGSLAIKSGASSHTISLTSPTSSIEIQPDEVAYSLRNVFLPMALRATFTGDTGGWSYDVRVNDAYDDSLQLFPDMAVESDGTLHVVWEDYRNGEYRFGSDVYYANSTDGGKTWSADKRVNNDTAASAAHRKPRIAVSPDGDVYVVWQDYRNDPNPADPSKTSEFSQNPDIYLAKLAKNQTSFGANVLVYDQGDLQSDPDVEVDSNGDVYVAWYDRTGDHHYGDSFVAKSTNGEASFGAPVKADNHSYWALEPRLAINYSDDNIYLVFQGHPSYYKPYFTRSSNGGATWSTDMQLDAGDNRDWFDAARVIQVVDDDNGHVFVIWGDERNDPDNCYTGCSSGHDEFDIFSTYSANGGVSWPTDNIMVNDDSTFAYITYPAAVFTPDGDLVAVWRDQRSGDTKGDIYMATSTNYGAAWSTNTRVDHAPSGFDANWPVVVADPMGAVYALWHDYRNGNWDIFMTKVGSP